MHSIPLKFKKEPQANSYFRVWLKQITKLRFYVEGRIFRKIIKIYHLTASNKSVLYCYRSSKVMQKIRGTTIKAIPPPQET